MRRRYKLKKQIFAVLMSITFIFSLFPQVGTVQALTKQQECEAAYTSQGKPSPPPGFPICITNGLSFQSKLFDDLGVVVYGGPDAVPGNDFKLGWQEPISPYIQHIDPSENYTLDQYRSTDQKKTHPYFMNKKGEYRYLGYDKIGTKFENPHFIDDKDGPDPQNRKWMFRPWDNLPNGYPNKPLGRSAILSGLGDLNTLSINEINTINSIIKTKEFRVQNSTNTNDLQRHLFNYMYVQQDPTVWAPGSGTMWSQGGDNRIYYQTFLLDKSTGKKMIPVEAKIKGVTNVDINKHPGNKVKIFLTLNGMIKDEDKVNDRFKRVEYYTRKDLDSWQLKLSYGGNTKTFSNAEVMRMQNQGYVEQYMIELDKSQLTDGMTMQFILEAKATFYSDPGPYPSATGNVVHSVKFNKTPICTECIPPATPSEPPSEVQETPPPPLVCSPNLPSDAFDIVAYPASDGTDMSRIQSREVYVDGVSVNPNTFYSGAYIFGDDADGVREIKLRWVAKPGEDLTGTDGCDTTRYVNVHDTKPRAQFDMGGTYKENRKLTADNTSEAANDSFVLATYPITNYDWTFSATSGSSDSDRRTKVNGSTHKEFLYKNDGTYRITFTVTNALGRTSDPYVLDFEVLEDAEPAVILHPYNSQIARTINLDLFYDAVSTDGDIIKTQTIKIYYDSDNNGTYDELVETINGPMATTYTPPSDKLGFYRIEATVDEDFGQDTIPEFITETDRRVTTVETWFEVDNLIPYNDVYTDIPYDRPEIDVYFMIDKNLAQNKIDYVKANPVTINNNLRAESINPEVNTWDMHTYIYSRTDSTSRSTGSSYPSSTYFYSSGGYSGTLSRTSVSDNGYYHDFGYTSTTTESKTATDSRSQSGTLACGQTAANTLPGSVSYNSGGFSGTLSQSSYNYSSTPCSGTPSTWSFSRSASYSGTVTRTVSFWVPDIRWVSSYTGYYSGITYRSVRQPYEQPYSRTTSYKYIVYLSDDIINELSDFNTVRNDSDAKIILIGNDSIQSQTTYEHFIENTGQPIEELVQQVIDYIASHNPLVSSTYVLLNEEFNIYTLEVDDENDTIIQKQMMYVHDADYFDNAMGLASFAVAEYDESAYMNDTFKTNFPQPGKYTVYRRVKDQPSADPAFAGYSYYSNEAKINIVAHRRPIADATLDWTYNSNNNDYDTTWVDKSFDYDHNVTDPEKGIVERKVRYQKDGGVWVYKVPENLDPGTYHLEYVVKDKEGVWSLPFVLHFTLAPAPPVQMDAKARTELYKFSMNSIPASEELRVYDIWTRYPYNHNLQVALFQNGVQRTTPKTVNYYTGTKSGQNIQWEDIVYQIPDTTPDGNYQLRLTAIGQGGVTTTMEWPVTVFTPIDLQPEAPNPLVVNQSQQINATTTKYPSTTTVIMFKGKSFQQTITLTGTQDTDNKNWTRAFTVPNVTAGNYILEYRSTTPSGKFEVKSVTVQLTHNRPPVAQFDWTPKPVWEGDTINLINQSTDPDPGETLSYVWSIVTPNGSTISSTQTEPRLSQVKSGIYNVTLQLTDSHLATHTTLKTITVQPLTIQSNVSHTPLLLKHHQDKKHRTTEHPKDFYAGEVFIVETISSPTLVKNVKAWIDTITMDGKPLYVETMLEQDKSLHHFSGELYDERFISLTKGLRIGETQIHFEIEYENGVIKTESIPVNIIGSIYQATGVHRRQ